MANLNSYICLSPASVALLLDTLRAAAEEHLRHADTADQAGHPNTARFHSAEAAKLDALAAAVQDQRAEGPGPDLDGPWKARGR